MSRIELERNKITYFVEKLKILVKEEEEEDAIESSNGKVINQDSEGFSCKEVKK
jgi:hypothetical protein